MAAPAVRDRMPPCLSGATCLAKHICGPPNGSSDFRAACLQLHPVADDRWVALLEAVAEELFDRACAQPLQVVLRHAIDFTASDTAIIALPTDSAQLEICAANGMCASELTGQTLHRETSIAGRVIDSGAPAVGELVLPAVSSVGQLRPVALVPLPVGLYRKGVLGVARLATNTAFTTADLEIVAGFAHLAGFALHLDAARERREAVAESTERDRLADTLRETVIRNLSEVLLGLDSLIGYSDNVRQRIRLQKSSVQVDSLIRNIQETIFDAPFRPLSELSEERQKPG